MTVIRKAARFLLAVLLTAHHGNALLAQAQSQAGNQDETIRLKSLLVDLRAVVTDKDGHTVERLTQQDFELLENDKPQPLAFFSAERIEAIARRPATVTNGQPELSTATPTTPPTLLPARTIVFFVDPYRLSLASLTRAKKSLLRFVDEQMTDNDLVAIISGTGQLGLLSQFTQDRALLHRAIDHLNYDPAVVRNTLLSPYLAAMAVRKQNDAVSLAAKILEAEDGTGLGAIGPAQAAQLIQNIDKARVEQRAVALLADETARRKATLAQLNAVAERLASLPGQRIIALLSQGFSLLDSSGASASDELRATAGRAARAGVIIYAIQPGGLETTNVSRADLPQKLSVDLTYQRFESNAREDFKNGIGALADSTGGKLLANSNDLNQAFAQALDENRAYYRLAYYPATTTDAHAFRAVVVRVKNHPEYSVRTQRGYLPFETAASARETDPAKILFAALAEPLARKELDIAVVADYLERAGDEAQATVQIDIDASRFEYHTQGQKNLLDLNMAIGIYNGKGEPVNTAFDTVHAAPKTNELEGIRQNGYRYTKRIALKPGQYQIRVGVRESAGQTIGTAMAWIDVPDLRRGQLATSSLILSQRASANNVNRPRAINGIRVYKNTEPLTYYLRLYNAPAEAATSKRWLMQSELVQGDQRIAQSEWEPLGAALLGSDRKGLEISGDINFSNAAAGNYELRVRIKNTESNQTVEQTVTFGITR